MPYYVDCHSHAVPSGDDGVRDVGEGLALCADAAAHGTAILFATPHVWPQLPLSDSRERAIRAAYEEQRAQAPLELRLGFELTPHRALLREDPFRYELAGTGCVLMEVPFRGDLGALVALAEHVEAAGLRPVIAHPERTEAVLEHPRRAVELARRGWLLQVNATSLLGRHGGEAEETGWRLVEDGHVAIVASDGHRPSRPARLDEAHAAVRARIGPEADALFDGSALAISLREMASEGPAASPADLRGA